ncbi:MAG: hypothetical protein ABIM89_16280 [Mycobacteriales bacterium]
MTTAHHDDMRTTGHRGWPAIASTVALALAAGSALLTIVRLLGYLTKDGLTTSQKVIATASGMGDTIAILLIAAILVLASGAFGGRDTRDGTAALVITITAALVAVVMLLSVLMSFGDKNEALMGDLPWVSRLTLLLGAIAAAAAAALANEARDRT